MLFFFQAEDGIRDLVRSRGLGDVYKRQVLVVVSLHWHADQRGDRIAQLFGQLGAAIRGQELWCLDQQLSLIHI